MVCFASSLTLVSCNNKTKVETTTTSSQTVDSTTTISDTTSMDAPKTAEALYACPMHPEVQGKLNDKCPKCGMKLTVPVSEKK